MKNISNIQILKIVILILIFMNVAGHPVILPDLSFKKIQKRDRIALAIEQEFQSTLDPASSKLPTDKLFAIRKELMRNASSQTREGDEIVWEERGPTQVAGRTRALLLDQTDASGNTLFAGSVAGGIWKCTQAKSNNPQWTQSSGMMNNLAIACLVQDPLNPQNIYAGTGEAYFNQDAIRGNGIWKSTDGGDHWSRLNSTANSDFDFVLKLDMNATGELFACTRNNGLMYSEDEGENWIKILGKNHFAESNQASDMVMSSNGDLYVAMGLNECDGIYRSQDNGSSWIKLENGLPGGNFHRIEMAMSASDPNRIYALFQDASSNGCMGIYSSYNQGENWSSLPLPQAYGMTNFTRNQAWYNLTIAVDPDNSERVIVGGIDLHLSEDGGNSWAQISQWGGYMGIDYVHADQHFLLFDSNNNDHVFFANDGGVARCLDLGAETIDLEHINDGYRVTQFYAAAIHPDGSNPLLLAGAQDNGTQEFISAGLANSSEVTGGDGNYCHIDQLDPNIQITSYVFNNYYISIDGGENFIFKDFNNNGRFSNPSSYDPVTKKLYASNWNGSYFRWNNPALAGDDKDYVQVNAFSSALVTAIKLSPSIPNQAYFGLSNGRVVKVNDIHEGVSKSGQLIFSSQTGNVSSIDIDPDNEDHLLVSLSNYNIPSIWESYDGGQSWTTVEGNLPNMPVRMAMFHPEESNKALLATEMGIWTTDELNGSGTTWIHSQNEMSFVRVDRIEIRPQDNYLVGVTHGRGLFSSSSLVRPLIGFEKSEMTFSEQASNGQSGYCNLNNQVVNIAVQIGGQPEQPITVSFLPGSDSSADQNEDFQILNPTMTFTPDGPVSQELSLRILDEAISENDEVIYLEIQGDDAFIGPNNTMEIHIMDDDNNPQLMYAQSFLVGSASSNVFEYPFGAYYEDGRSQFLFHAEELIESGLSAGNIEKIAFNVIQKQSVGPFENFNIRMKQVEMNAFAMPGGDFIDGGTEVFSSSLTTQYAWNEITFDQSFYWNGEKDLLVDICYDNQSWSNNDHVSSSMTSFNSVAFMQADVSQGCSFLQIGDISNNRPDIKFFTTAGVSLADMTCSKNSSIIQGDLAHFYSDGKLIASIENLEGGSIECMEMEIDRIGQGIDYPEWAEGSGISQKTFFIDAMFNAPYQLSLYFHPEDLENWVDPLSLNMMKSESRIAESDGSDIQILSNDALMVETLEDGVIVYRAIFDDFSGFALTDLAQSTLHQPVLRFEVEKRKNANYISWELDKMPGLNKVWVERSLHHPDQFEQIWNRKTEVFSGQYVDAATKPGKSYYRLVYEDEDANRSYSAIELVTRKAFPEFSDIFIYPNPAREVLYIESNKEVDGIYPRIINLSGKGMNVSIQKLNDNRWQISTGELAPGLYWLSLPNKQGKPIWKKFFKS